MLLSAEESQVLIVDIQGRLMPAMDGPERVVERTAIVTQAARRLGIPVSASRQYPIGLGPLVPEIEALLEEGETLDKTAFSCAADSGLAGHVAGKNRKQIVICGVETHVCVLQTAFGFLAQGLNPYVVIDACSSRKAGDKSAAIDRMRSSGIHIVTSEMVCFEWMGEAGTDAFKDISKLIK
ncbi:hydrolase [Hwanghaeella sp.]|uniref:hydrolase n=1 Tax=Hwanghaeella sp. TaxID=2605943 RepID=UPI003CCBCEF9